MLDACSLHIKEACGDTMSGGSEMGEHGDIDESRGSNPERAIEQGSTISSILETIVEMPSEGREIEDHGDIEEAVGTHLEMLADHPGIIPHEPGIMRHQPGANNDPNGQEGRDLQSQPWFMAHTFGMAAEVALLALHFQGSSSPFKTHPTKMWIFVFAMLTTVGAALYYGKSRIRGFRRSEICDLIGYISGSLASAAFLSMLVPTSLVPFVFVIWGLHLPIYFDAVRKWILNHLPNIWNRNRGNNDEGATDAEN